MPAALVKTPSCAGALTSGLSIALAPPLQTTLAVRELPAAVVHVHIELATAVLSIKHPITTPTLPAAASLRDSGCSEWVGGGWACVGGGRHRRARVTARVAINEPLVVRGLASSEYGGEECEGWGGPPSPLPAMSALGQHQVSTRPQLRRLGRRRQYLAH